MTIESIREMLRDIDVDITALSAERPFSGLNPASETCRLMQVKSSLTRTLDQMLREQAYFG